MQRSKDSSGAVEIRKINLNFFKNAIEVSVTTQQMLRETLSNKSFEHVQNLSDKTVPLCDSHKETEHFEAF